MKKKIFILTLLFLFSCNLNRTSNNYYKPTPIPSYPDYYDSGTNVYIPPANPSTTSTPNPINISSNKIFFMSNRDGFWEIYSMNKDGSEQLKVTQENMKNAYTFSISPDGKKIAYISDKTGSHDLWILDLETKQTTQLTDTPKIDEGSPSWSPDNRSILFHSLNEATGFYQIVKLDFPNLSNAKPRVILFDDKNDLFHPIYSPDGKKILYSLSDKDNKTALYVLDLVTKTPNEIVPKEAGAYSGSWSNDSQKILYWTLDNGIFNIDVTGKNNFQIGTVKNNRGNPIYSNDGNKIIISRGNGLPEDYNVWIMDSDGKNLQKLTSLGGISLAWGKNPVNYSSYDSYPTTTPSTYPTYLPDTSTYPTVPPNNYPTVNPYKTPTPTPTPTKVSGNDYIDPEDPDLNP
ncbi:MAG: hypothetical protein U0457_07385 [Candidatus Sericytochromatia bacterium]